MSLFENRFNERRQQKEDWIREIETLLDDLKANSETIVSLLHQRDLLSQKIKTDEQLDQVHQSYQKEIEGFELKLKWADEEREKMREQLRLAIEMLRDKQTYIQEQEDSIRTLQSEIKRMKELIAMKSEEIKRLEREI